MPDNKKAKKADRRRVALKTQDYERFYLADMLESCASRLHHEADKLESQVIRLRAGSKRK